MRLSTTFIAITGFIILTACADTQNDIDKKSRATGGFVGMDKASYDVNTGEAFKDVKQVVIGSFKIGFLQEKKNVPIKEALVKETKPGNVALPADVKLTNITMANMQHITDAAHADFVSRLKRKGYTVVDRSALLKNRDFAHANKKASPMRKDASFFGNDATETYVAPSSFGSLYFVGESGESGGFGFSNPQVAAINFAEESKIQVLFVSYQLDFTDKEGGQRISVPPGNGIRLIGGKGDTFNTANGSILLGQAVYSTAPCGEVIDKTEGIKETKSAVNLLSAVLGSGPSRNRRFEMKADAAKYQSVGAKVLADANEKLVSKMATLR